MNPFNNTQLKSLRTVRLSDSEKGVMRSAIKAEMAKLPLHAEACVRIGEQERYQLRRADVNNNFKKKIMPITILIALIMGGGVSYAAEGTLPGDTLYPVKIHVNENIRSAFAVSSTAQAELEITLAERRLMEAERLEAEGRLDMETKAELRGQVEAHSQRAVVEITNVTAADTVSGAKTQGEVEIKLNAIGEMLEVLEVNVQGGALDEERNTTMESSLDASGTVVNTLGSTTLPTQSQSGVQSETQVEVSGRTTTQVNNSGGATNTSGSIDAITELHTTFPVAIPAP